MESKPKVTMAIYREDYEHLCAMKVVSRESIADVLHKVIKK